MMSSELLRQRILDYAIHGKLIENNQKLSSINIEEVKENIPFEIPDNWKWVSLGKIGVVISGTSYDKSKISESGIRILRGGNISDNKLSLYGDDVFLPTEYYSEDKQVQLGDIVLVASTGSMDVIGKPAIVTEEMANTQIGAFLRIVRTKKEFSKYIGLIFMSDYYRNQIRDLVKGMAINNIKNGYLLNMLIPLPPLEEQNEITSKVYELFKLIEIKEKNDKETEKLKEVLKEKIIDSAIHGTLVENDSSLKPIDIPEIKNNIPFAIPSNWRWSTLNNIFDVKGGKRIPKGESFSDSGTQVYIRVADMSNMTISLSNLKYIDERVRSMIKNYIITSDDLYITVAGTIGQVGSVPKELDGMNLTENANRLIPKNIDKEFYKYILNGKYMQSEIRNNTTKAAQPKLAIKRINDLVIPVPPLEEQKRIVEKIEKAFELIEQL